jgi:hypothetical protein
MLPETQNVYHKERVIAAANKTLAYIYEVRNYCRREATAGRKEWRFLGGLIQWGRLLTEEESWEALDPIDRVCIKNRFYVQEKTLKHILAKVELSVGSTVDLTQNEVDSLMYGLNNPA